MESGEVKVLDYLCLTRIICPSLASHDSFPAISTHSMVNVGCLTDDQTFRHTAARDTLMPTAYSYIRHQYCVGSKVSDIFGEGYNCIKSR